MPLLRSWFRIFCTVSYNDVAATQLVFGPAQAEPVKGFPDADWGQDRDSQGMSGQNR